MGTIRQLPSYLRLLFGLLADARVSMVDKALVAGAVLYIISPFDLITDAIPFIGQVDDVFLLVTALQRLITNAGRRVVLEHWTGPTEDLHDLNLQRVLTAASFFLPGRIRRRLKMLGR
ncbi:MAG TPA: YkvA family protein [Gemmatimonadaceae bacterium]|nr:YkvA family protein [Gemmatimonadaceae bacterium]